jgi:hypothetical protein
MIGSFATLPCQDCQVYCDWFKFYGWLANRLAFLLDHNTIIRGTQAANHKIQLISGSGGKYISVNSTYTQN